MLPLITRTGLSKHAQSNYEFLKREFLYLTQISPSFARDVSTLNHIVIADTSPWDTEEHMTFGTHHWETKTITVYSHPLKERYLSMMVLLHEIGHHVRHQKGRHNEDYSSEKENAAYWEEEIAAESYAFHIARRYLVSEKRGSWLHRWFWKLISWNPFCIYGFILQDVTQNNIKIFKEKLAQALHHQLYVA